MLRIRFFRIGKKNQPLFKIVVTDKKKPPRGGRFVEEVGFWNPLTKEKVLKKERIKYWLSVGAKSSDTVYNLLIKEGILKGKKISLHKKKKEKPASADSASVAEATSAKGATTGKKEKPPTVPPAATSEGGKPTEEKTKKKTEEKPAEVPKEETKQKQKPEAEPAEQKPEEKPKEEKEKSKIEGPKKEEQKAPIGLDKD